MNGLNLPHCIPQNLPRIEAGLAYCKTNRISIGRIDLALAENTLNGYDPTLHRQVRGLFSQYGIKPHIVLNSNVPNKTYWRKFICAETGQTDEEVWKWWVARSEAKDYMFWNSKSGVHPALWAPLDDVFNQMISVWNPYITQIENEPGNVYNATLTPGITYGEVPAAFRQMMNLRVQRLSWGSSFLAAPAWETETTQGFYRQHLTGEEEYTRACTYQAINLYVTYQPGDTATSLANKLMTQLKVYVSHWWPGRPILLSEIGVAGCPLALRDATRRAFQSLSYSKVAHRIWFDYDHPDWGLVSAAATDADSA